MKMKIFLTVVISLPVMLIATVSAAPSSLANCGSSNPNIYTYSTTIQQTTVGSLYIKSANQSGSATVTAYYQSADGQCHEINETTAKFGQWNFLGTLNNKEVMNGGETFIVQSSNLGAPPYEAVADILVLPEPSICTPTVQCYLNFDGYSGYIQPKLLSGATDQVAVFQADPISTSNITSVDYYDGNTFLYKSTSLSPVNKNYLNGGFHRINIVLIEKNGEEALLSKNVNMGVDYTGSLYAKSLLYRSYGILRLFALLGFLILVLVIVALVLRRMYKHRQYVLEHGLEHDIVPVQNHPEDRDKNIHVG
jgi:hypothetical protein